MSLPLGEPSSPNKEYMLWWSITLRERHTMTTTTTDDHILTALAQTRLTSMPGHIACAVRQAMYDDGYLQDFGDGDMKTFSPFDGMESEFTWEREAYVRAALESLAPLERAHITTDTAVEES